MSQFRVFCDLCGSKSFLNLYDNIGDYETNIKQKVDLLKCENCNLIQQNLIFNNEEISSFYKEDYTGRNYNFSYNLTYYLRKIYYSRFIKILSNKLINKGAISVLDYGSGDGFLSLLLRQKGFKDITCCDFFEPDFLNYDIDYIHPSNIKSLNKKFDVVFMINSIEHLSSFKRNFGDIVKNTSIGGFLIIETPNFESLDSNLFKRYWGGLHQPRHTFLWSKEILKVHLESFGLKINNFGSPQSAHWAISVQNFLSSKIPFLKLILKNGRMPGYVFLVIFFTPLSIIQNFFGNESVLNVIAEKVSEESGND